MTIKMDILRNAARVNAFAARMIGNGFVNFLISSLINDHSLVQKIDTPSGSLSFWCPSETSWWRAKTLLTKEPETIEWIDGFDDGDVFWDIGANVGVYSLYAALRPGIRVLAFEPSPFNYHALCKNVLINSFSDKISAYCLAFSNKSVLDKLRMWTLEIGGALSNFGEEEVDWGSEYRHVHEIGMLGFAMDDFIGYYDPPFPNHIKIDVDGIEALIIRGGNRVLSDKRLRSVSIELDENRMDEIMHVSELLIKAGLMLKHRKHSIEIDKSPFASVFNYLFVRSN